MRSFRCRVPSLIRSNALSGAGLGARVLYRDGYTPARYRNGRIVGLLK